MQRYGCLPLLRGMLVLLLVLAWSGCSSPGRPVIVERGPASQPASTSEPRSRASTPRSRPSVHVVKRGDTLYAIAWRYGMEVGELARNNRLREPYIIYPGQKLKVAGRRSTTGAAPPVVRPAAPPTVAAAPRKRSGTSSSPTNRQRASAPAPVWRWPTNSPVVRDFGGANKGLDFELKAGASVRAAAQGSVVYAGSGLGGYERLVIVKHNDTYLSAYSLNHPYAVREGQRLKTGDRIASMGQGSAKTRTLHFEIRRDGNPVDPRKLLRKR